jgi:hypothetical protein
MASITKYKVNGYECHRLTDTSTGQRPKQAEIMRQQFNSILKILEIMPGMGTIYQDGMRKFPLGKFRIALWKAKNYKRWKRL